MAQLVLLICFNPRACVRRDLQIEYKEEQSEFQSTRLCEARRLIRGLFPDRTVSIHAPV